MEEGGVSREGGGEVEETEERGRGLVSAPN